MRWKQFTKPHSAVLSEDKSSNKVRIVFDANVNAKGEFSLTDCLYTGLNLIIELFSLLIKFRYLHVEIYVDLQQGSGFTDRDWWTRHGFYKA